VVTDFDMLGKTDREISRHREAEANSRSAFERRWQLLWDVDGDTETAGRLYDAIEQSKAANARQIVIDWVDGSHFFALTDCPLAYLKMEAAHLGIRDVRPWLSGDVEDYQEDINALERGEPAPNDIGARWR
jgi:hypothetical protein